MIVQPDTEKHVISWKKILPRNDEENHTDISSFVWTDGQTDGQTDRIPLAITALYTASNADTL